MSIRAYVTVIVLLQTLLAASAVHAHSPHDATDHTRRSNEAFAATLPFSNRRDFELVQKGFIARLPSTVIKNAEGNVVWDMDQFAYQALDAPAPDTVNPSLWRIAVLNSQHGLYEVTEGIYQVRGYDLSNITFVEGDTGYIVIDPLITKEVASAALDLLYQHRPRKPIVAVIYSHPHADHFGGVRGVVSREDVDSGKVPVIAPQGFMDHAVSENVLAGNAMSRRAAYMFGSLIGKNAKGSVGSGLGKGISGGEITLIEPTRYIRETGERMIVDGVEMIFQSAPGAEAPVEIMIYFPQAKAFFAAEEANAHLHNLYTLRGAQVRDALLWAGHLDKAMDFIGEDVEVLFGAHHRPRWGRDNILEYLANQRDLYKYIHDQTLRLANHGFTPIEIAEQVTLPDALAQVWYNRGYYGSVNHNVKAVYQRYLGWFDGNPANLHPLPPTESSIKYVEFMGGAENVLAMARRSYEAGDYRWVAEVMNHVIFAQPDHEPARLLQAQALEQLGYQAESGPWRNFYLTGAQELRNGVAPGITARSVSPDMVGALTLDQLFDYVAVRLNGPKASRSDIRLNFHVTDAERDYRVTVANGVLNYASGRRFADAQANVSLSRRALAALMLAGKPLPALVEAGLVQVDGNPQKLEELLSLLDSFEFWFNIVEP